jgi:hypothetical protein
MEVKAISLPYSLPAKAGSAPTLESGLDKHQGKKFKLVSN